MDPKDRKNIKPYLVKVSLEIEVPIAAEFPADAERIARRHWKEEDWQIDRNVIFSVSELRERRPQLDGVLAWGPDDDVPINSLVGTPGTMAEALREVGSRQKRREDDR